VRGATFVLRDAAGGSVPADVAYQAASRTAVLRPKAPLKGSSLYSATIAGGAGGVTDISGSPLPQDRTWSFTTAVGPSSSGSGAPGSASGKGGTGASSGSRRAGPRVGLTPRTIRASSAGIVKLRVACPSGTGGCRVALRLELSHRAVAAKTLTVGSGKARTFTLKLSRAARRELLRKGSLRVTAVAVASDHAGRRATTRTPTRLLAPRRR